MAHNKEHPDIAIKAARLGAHLTQQGMSDTTGIPKRTIENWETNVNTPPEWVRRLVLEKLKRMKRSE
jgi:DNA-binding transcriptional regulator YiaG